MGTQYDIAVVGGGSAGILAAWTAAKLGARVALIDATRKWGGMVQYGLHRWICGLFPCDVQEPREFLHGEGVERFCRLLAGEDPRERAVRRGRVWLLPIDSGDAFSACAEALLSEASGIDRLCGERVVSVTMTAEAGTSSTPHSRDENKARLQAVQLESGKSLEASVFVDCTGRASLCEMAHASVVRPAAPAFGGYGFEVEGLQEAKAGPLGLAIDVPGVCRKGVEAGLFPREFRYTTCEASSTPGCAWIRMAALAGARVEELQEAAQKLFASLKQEHPAFREARIKRLMPDVLLREGLRVRGRYILTEDDVLSARTFPDAVARNSWPVERWDPDRGVRYGYLPEGLWHDIPARCLQPELGPENLLCAGMMISADSAAQASVRVIGTCMATGEAAGKRAVRQVL